MAASDKRANAQPGSVYGPTRTCPTLWTRAVIKTCSSTACCMLPSALADMPPKSVAQYACSMPTIDIATIT
eukprot:11724605-Alexandrium_andersonii.AAC.1